MAGVWRAGQHMRRWNCLASLHCCASLRSLAQVRPGHTVLRSMPVTEQAPFSWQNGEYAYAGSVRACPHRACPSPAPPTHHARCAQASTLVLAEHKDARLAPAALSAVTAATQLGAPVTLLVTGQGLDAIAQSARGVLGVMQACPFATRASCLFKPVRSMDAHSLPNTCTPTPDHPTVACAAVVRRGSRPGAAQTRDFIPQSLSVRSCWRRGLQYAVHLWHRRARRGATSIPRALTELREASAVKQP